MRRVLYPALRLAAGALFIASGYTKLLAPYQDFLAAIHGYKILSGPPAVWLALALPWAEVVFGLYALVGLWTRASLAALWGMNAMFLAAVGSALLRKLPLESCGCFGEAGGVHFAPRDIFLVDVAFMLVFILLFRFSDEASAWSLDRFFSKSAR